MNQHHFENFQPSDFLSLAEKLIEYNEEHELDNSSLERTIYGRIYYGTFLFVRTWLDEKTDFNVKNTGKDHQNIPRYLKVHGPFEPSKNNMISDDIKTLKKLRHQADYYLKFPDENSREYNRWISDDVHYALDLAENIINSFNELDQDLKFKN